MTPSTVPTDVPPLEVSRRRGVLEVDAFCAGCQYNLHGQPVTIDDRLQLPVCRCPECGRFHPAGVGVSASGVWLRRLASLLLATWVAVVLAAAAGCCFVLGALDVGAVVNYAVGAQATMSDPPRPYRTVALPANVPNPGPRFLETMHPILGGPVVPNEFQRDQFSYDAGPYGMRSPELEARVRDGPGPGPWLWVAAGSVVMGAVVGGLAATFLWHWPRWRYLWCLVNPAVAAAVVTVGFSNADEWVLCHGMLIARILGMAAVQCGGVVLGIAVGRPVARGVLRTVVPPRPRQALAFLWQVDGKPMPVPRG